MGKSNRALLFQPPYRGRLLGPPLGLLSLAGSLRQAGYEPVLIDGALDRNYLSTILNSLDGAICFGVSLLTGPMIREAISASRLVREVRPDLPIIYGGWHPSLRSAETLREDFVDMVVRHQGDRTLVDILDCLAAGREPDLISGCWFKRGGRIISNPDRPAAALTELPPPAYDLVDFDAYERAGAGRKLPYATSVGCPYACNYCTDMVFYNRRFNAYEAERVVGEMIALVRRYRISDVALVDSNFLVDIHRATAIARGISESGAAFNWSFQASTDLLCRMSDDEVRLLAASGVNHIGFGTESASPEVLTAMNKRHQSVEDIGEAARKCAQAGIRITLNLIFGYPGEEERHRRQTLRIMSDIGARHENVVFSPNIFTAYPGIPIWPELKQLGMREPAALEDWADVDLGAHMLPWLQGKPFRTLQRSISYLHLANELSRARAKTRWPVLDSLLKIMRKPLQWRIRHHFFTWPIELWLSMARSWMVMRRSLLTGEPLSRTLSR